MGFENLWLDLVDDNPLGLLLEGLIFIYCFAGLASVCDKFLVVSLETLCVRWGVREDVAGATFMAFGSAAPEIIINAIGTITGESDLGVGAIIGSGMIAFSIIPGLCALVAGADLMLKRRPLARDSLFYLLALSCLTYFFSDGFVTTGEAVTLFLLYVTYVTLVFLSPNIRQWMQGRKRRQQYEAARQEAMSRGADRAQLEELKERYLTAATKKSFVEQAAEREAAAKKAGGANNLGSALLGDGPAASDGGDGTLSPKGEEEDAEYVPPSHADEEEEEEDNTWKGQAWRAFTAPLTLAFKYTCIPCEHDGPGAKWYPLTFAVAFIWVSFFSFTISAVAGRWNELSGLPLSLFGIVLVAVGAEIPDTISSLAVARRGYGSMAISNSCGSQITNILFGLGLPWTMANLIGLASKRVKGNDPCIAYLDANPDETSCPDDVAFRYGYDPETVSPHTHPPPTSLTSKPSPRPHPSLALYLRLTCAVCRLWCTACGCVCAGVGGLEGCAGGRPRGRDHRRRLSVPHPVHLHLLPPPARPRHQEGQGHTQQAQGHDPRRRLHHRGHRLHDRQQRHHTPTCG